MGFFYCLLSFTLTHFSFLSKSSLFFYSKKLTIIVLTTTLIVKISHIKILVCPHISILTTCMTHLFPWITTHTTLSRKKALKLVVFWRSPRQHFIIVKWEMKNNENRQNMLSKKFVWSCCAAVVGFFKHSIIAIKSIEILLTRPIFYWFFIYFILHAQFYTLWSYKVFK